MTADDSTTPLATSGKEARERGLATYQGKPCKHGHSGIRYTAGGCVGCCKHIRRVHPAAASVHGPRHKAYLLGLKTYQGRPCKHGHDGKRYVSSLGCVECERLSMKRRYARDPVRMGKMVHAWDKANPDHVRARVRRYQAAKRASGGTFTVDDVARIRKLQRDRCGYCRVPLKGVGHIDHIVPVSKGGSNWPTNLQLLCAPCNVRKSAHDPIDFAQSLGRLL